MEQESMKPCPFCGGEAKAWEYEDEQDVFDPISLGWVDTRCVTWHCVGCESCEIVISRLSKDDALAAWNARAAVTDEQFATAVHDGRAWRRVRECHAVLKSEPCYLPDDPPEVDEYHECSECGEVFPYGPEGYCPRCGAKVAAVGIMRLVTLYDEEGAEGIECSECGWSEIHDWDDPIPDHCPMCKRKVAPK